MTEAPANGPSVGRSVGPSMTEQEQSSADRNENVPPPRILPPEALRALKEAEERRRGEKAEAAPARETGGRGGLDPARYGDWEVKGLASDF